MFGVIEFFIAAIPAVIIAGAAVLGYVLLIKLFDDGMPEEDEDEETGDRDEWEDF